MMKKTKNRELITTYAKIVMLIGILFICSPLKAQHMGTEKSGAAKSSIICFRWNSDTLEWDYFENANTKREIERIFANEMVLKEIDSVVISASASPEGNTTHNEKLSQRRLNVVLNYMFERYPSLDKKKVQKYSLGPYWDGLLPFVEEDNKIPHREEMLALLKNKELTDTERERQLREIGNGAAYRYMNKNIFRYLRAGSTLVLFYPKRLESIINPGKEIYILQDTISSLQPTKLSIDRDLELGYTAVKSSIKYRRPIAIKTNLLFDAATLFNVELEVSIGKHFSIMGEWTFPFWGGLGNRGGVAPLPLYSEKYTLQMLSGGLEARYWFPRGKRVDSKAQRWGDYNPLIGWFIGLYGGAGLYDFQRDGKGMQGEFYITAGLSGGYAHPIGRHFHMEYSVGVGYLSTDYYKYHAAEGLKIVDLQPDGSYDRRKQTWIGPTKAKISLVWIPQFKVKKRK